MTKETSLLQIYQTSWRLVTFEPCSAHSLENLLAGQTNPQSASTSAELANNCATLDSFSGL